MKLQLPKGLNLLLLLVGVGVLIYFATRKKPDEGKRFNPDSKVEIFLGEIQRLS